MKASNKKVFDIVSFITLIVVAFLILIEHVFPRIGINISGVFINVLRTISNMFILFILGITAYNFIPGKKKWVKVIYWVSVAVFLVATFVMWI